MPTPIPIEKTVKYTVYGRYCAKDFKTGEYCRFLAFKRFGTESVCVLYNQEKLYSDSESIERCQQCLNDWE